MKQVSLDYLPLLVTFLSSRQIKVSTFDFDDLELAALTELSNKWPGTFFRVNRDKFWLECPKDRRHYELAKEVRLSLTQFYMKHGMVVSYTIKRGYSKVRILFESRVDATFIPPQEGK